MIIETALILSPFIVPVVAGWIKGMSLGGLVSQAMPKDELIFKVDDKTFKVKIERNVDGSVVQHAVIKGNGKAIRITRAELSTVAAGRRLEELLAGDAPEEAVRFLAEALAVEVSYLKQSWTREKSRQVREM